MNKATFTPLPTPDNAEGARRRVGVEIEFGGLDEAEAARCLAECLGGTAEQVEETLWAVSGSDIGDIEVYLDTALRKLLPAALRDAGLALGREVIPVEIVTKPLDMAGLAKLDEARAALREKGATGSGSGLLLGFGVHLNIEIASETDAAVIRPLLAYALIEDWLRWSDPVDDSRRVLPFIDPYPHRFVRGLLELGPGATLSAVMDLYLKKTPTRNRGLDMLPIFAHFDARKVASVIEGKTSARPAFHFRLPDCRIDERDWTLAREWNRWLIVERVAEDADTLNALRDAWLSDHGAVTLIRSHWAERTNEILRDRGFEGALE